MTKMYTELASWWHLLSAPEDYAEEAALYGGALQDACDGRPRTLLELGSGGGNNASHLKARFDVTLVDLSADMLDRSRNLNPECEHIQGDMRSVRLGREFDTVFVHDAIMYMTTEEDLAATIETAYRHTRPGGAALFVPDHLAENFEAWTSHGGNDGNDRAMRYLAWAWDPDPEDTTFLTQYVYVLRDADGSTRVVEERHTQGLFPGSAWLRLLRQVGYEPEERGFVLEEEDQEITAFLARKSLGA